MRLVKLLVTISFLLGAVLWGIGASYPVYSDARAPERLSQELQDKPRDVRFREWYSQLPTFETPHKRLTDLGRGFLAAGIAEIACLVITSLWSHFQGRWRYALFCIGWLVLWGLKVPLSAWYYGVRQKRFDFPVWGDSTAIPVMSETFTWIIGAAVTLPLALLMMKGRTFPSVVQFIRPHSILAWIRFSTVIIWLLFLVVCIISGISDGDEGMTISCLAAVPFLLYIASAEPYPPLANADTTSPIEGEQGGGGISTKLRPSP